MGLAAGGKSGLGSLPGNKEQTGTPGKGRLSRDSPLVMLSVSQTSGDKATECSFVSLINLSIQFPPRLQIFLVLRV